MTRSLSIIFNARNPELRGTPASAAEGELQTNASHLCHRGQTTAGGVCSEMFEQVNHLRGPRPVHFPRSCRRDALPALPASSAHGSAAQPPAAGPRLLRQPDLITMRILTGY